MSSALVGALEIINNAKKKEKKVTSNYFHNNSAEITVSPEEEVESLR